MKKYIHIILFIFTFLFASTFVRYNCNIEIHDFQKSFKHSVAIESFAKQEQIEKSDLSLQNRTVIFFSLKRNYDLVNKLLFLIFLFFVRKYLFSYSSICFKSFLDRKLVCNFLRLQILKSKAHPPTYFSF